jgi:hypothetical protein
MIRSGDKAPQYKVCDGGKGPIQGRVGTWYNRGMVV